MPPRPKERLRDIPASGWREIARRMRSATKRHHASILAGGVAFYGFLSMFPGLAALVSVYGLLANPADVRKRVDALAAGLPDEVQTAIYDEITQFMARSSGALTVEAVISILATVWAATKGTKALITGLSLAFGLRETRGFIRLNVTAFLFTMGAIVMGAIGVAALIAFPVVLSFLHLSQPSERLIGWLRWPALAIVVLFGLAVAYHHGPAQTPTRWRWVTIGSAAATISWLIGSALFSWFASSSAASDRIDGSLAAIITLLTWFLLSAYVVILGAELDVEVDRQLTQTAASRPTQEP